MSTQYTCPVCTGPSPALDVVDFNKSCEEARGRFLPLSGTAVYYHLCDRCGFCFAPKLHKWTAKEFEEKIYNRDYVQVDPDYRDTRPRSNAKGLVDTFGASGPGVRHLDYGGGSGLMSELLRTAGWDSSSYDPFIDRKVKVRDLGTFGLITAYEVFEHVPDIATLMTDLRSLLAPDGVVLFSTMLADGNLGRHQRLTWWYASPRNGHISLYSRASLELLAERHGLKFGSFSPGMHALWRTVPAWAKGLTALQQ